MLVLYIFILMFTNSINHIQKNIHSTYINRITIITLLVSIIYTYNTLHFQSIGKGISLYNGLYQSTIQSHLVEILLLIVGISILISWPFINYNKKNTMHSIKAAATLSTYSPSRSSATLSPQSTPSASKASEGDGGSTFLLFNLRISTLTLHLKSRCGMVAIKIK